MKKLITIIAGIIAVYKWKNLGKKKSLAQPTGNNSFPSLSQVKQVSTSNDTIRYTEGIAEGRIKVEKYIEAVVSSSRRMRGVVLVLITVSILSFNTYWRARGPWLSGRVEIRRAALLLFDANKQPQRFEYDQELYQRGQDYLKLRGFDTNNSDDKARLVQEINELEKKRMEQDVIHVPFFGVEVEANDVTFFSGYAFVIGLLWLRFSLLRELQNLKIAFVRAKEQDMMRFCYELLSMQQWLGNPPVHDKGDTRTWTLIPKVLFMTPATIYVVLVINDSMTFRIGLLLNPYVMITFIMSCLFLTFILILTVQCLQAAIKIERLWEKMASDVGYKKSAS